MRTLLIPVLVSLINHLTWAQTQLWQQTNGPIGGYIGLIAVNKNGTGYATTMDNGIFRSTDDGLTWTQAGLKGYSFNSLEVSAKGTILAGHFSGLVRSTDDGSHWLEVAPIQQYSGIAVAAALLGQVFASFGGLVFRSTDDGATWERHDTGIDFSNSSIECLAIDVAGRVYAGASGRVSGVYQSTDGGSSWTLRDPSLDGREVRLIAIDSSGAVYAASYVGMSRSTNAGERWERLRLPVDTALFTAITTRDQGEVVVGTALYGAFRSTDFGSTWAAFGQGLPGQGSLWSFPMATNKASGSIYAGVSSEGMYRNVKGKPEWDLMIFPSTAVPCIAGDQEGRILSSDLRTGIWRTTDNGRQWLKCNQGLIDTNISHLFSLSSGTLLAFAQTSGSICRSTNGGDSWIPANVGLTNVYVRSAAIDSVGQIYLATHSGIFLSSDEGETWSKASSISTGSDAFAVTPNGVLFAYVYVPPPVVYAVGGSGGAWALADTGLGLISKSTDAGKTWSRADSGLIGFLPQFLFAGRDRSLHAGGPTGLFSSKNGGLSWRRSLTLANAAVTSLVQNSHGDLFAGTSDGRVFHKMRNDTSWSNVSDGLPQIIIKSMAISSDGYLFAATDGSGVFRSLKSTTSVEELYRDLPVYVFLSQNYPNPFNPSTTIRYDLPKSAKVTMKIFNTLGQEVAMLVNARKDAGSYEVHWSASNVPSGVYFYRLQAGEHVETGKMILLK